MSTRCPHCHGKKSIRDSKTFSVEIPRGVQNGKEIVFEGEGDVVSTALPGDVVFKVVVKKNSNFRRDGKNLYSKLRISFKEAVIGFEKEIKHLDGRVIKVVKKGSSNCNELVRVEKEGMPSEEGGLGDLFVELIYSLPKKISIK